MFLRIILMLIAAYLMGSIPTAVIVSKQVKGVDIRTLGDGNMGARNVFRTLGFRASLVVALTDVCKGSLVVLAAHGLGLPQVWQATVGLVAVLGHDFPVFAHFQGGQGLATTLGVMLALFPRETYVGLIVYGLLYLITRLSDISAGIGCGLIFIMLVVQHQWLWVGVVVVLMLIIPVRKVMVDRLHARLDPAQRDEHKKSAAG